MGRLGAPDGQTGTHSVFTRFRDIDVMFHVSTLLPYSDMNAQQVRTVRRPNSSSTHKLRGGGGRHGRTDRAMQRVAHLQHAAGRPSSTTPLPSWSASGTLATTSP